MNYTLESFQERWLYKLIHVKSYYTALPDVTYIVTAALWKRGNQPAVFCIMAEDYNVENKHWYKMNLSDEDLEKLDERFEIANSSPEELKKAYDRAMTMILKMGDL